MSRQRRSGALGIAVFVLALAGIAAAIGVYRAVSAGSDGPAAIPTFEVRRAPFVVEIASIGVLEALKSSSLRSPFEGKIIKLVPEGARVNEGDPVIWMETTTWEEEVRDLLSELGLAEKDLQSAKDGFELEKVKNEYSLESEKTQVKIAEQNYADAKQKFESERVLFERKISPQTKLDEARLALLSAQLSMQNAKINLAKVQENLDGNLRNKQRDIDRAQLNVDKTKVKIEERRKKIADAIIRATNQGDISYLTIWKGNTSGKIAEGDQVWNQSSLALIPDPSVMMAIVPVNEIDISQIEPGQTAEISLEALPGEKLTGVVEGKSAVPITDQTRQPWRRGQQQQGESGPREFEVRVRITESHPLFRQGMTAAARIKVAHIDDALQVPIEAIFSKDGKEGVYVERGGGPEFVAVKRTLSNDNFAALEGGVKPGDRVLLADPFAGSAETGGRGKDAGTPRPNGGPGGGTS